MGTGGNWIVERDSGALSMRIAMVSYPAGTDTGVGVLELAQAVSGLGHTVELLTRGSRRSGRARRAGGVPTRELAGPSGPVDEPEAMVELGPFIDALSGQLRESRFDVVHTHGWLGGMAGQLARPQRGTALVHTFEHLHLMDGRDPVTGRAASRARLRAEHAVAARAHYIIATHHVQRAALVRAGVSQEQVSVVPRGARIMPDATGTAPGPRSRTLNARAVGRPRIRRVLIVGVSLGRSTRLDELAEVLSETPTIALTVCDTPTDPLGPHAGYLSGLAVNPAKQLRLTRADTGDILSALISEADLVISGERAGTAHLEAMAAGIPVVAASPEVAEAVQDGVSGVHAVEAPIRPLAYSVRELLADLPRRHAMGLAARERALARYSWPRIAEITVGAYRRHSSHEPDPVREPETTVPEPRRVGPGSRP